MRESKGDDTIPGFFLEKSIVFSKNGFLTMR